MGGVFPSPTPLTTLSEGIEIGKPQLFVMIDQYPLLKSTTLANLNARSGAIKNWARYAL